MLGDELRSVEKIANLNNEQRESIICCLKKRDVVFQDPNCEFAMGLLGKDHDWVEQALRYPPIYYISLSRRRDFERAIRILGDILAKIGLQQYDCCTD